MAERNPDPAEQALGRKARPPAISPERARLRAGPNEKRRRRRRLEAGALPRHTLSQRLGRSTGFCTLRQMRAQRIQLRTPP